MQQTQPQQHKPVRRAEIRIRRREACRPPEPSSTFHLYRAAPDTLPRGIWFWWSSRVPPTRAAPLALPERLRTCQIQQRVCGLIRATLQHCNPTLNEPLNWGWNYSVHNNTHHQNTPKVITDATCTNEVMQPIKKFKCIIHPVFVIKQYAVYTIYYWAVCSILVLHFKHSHRWQTLLPAISQKALQDVRGAGRPEHRPLHATILKIIAVNLMRAEPLFDSLLDAVILGEPDRTWTRRETVIHEVHRVLQQTHKKIVRYQSHTKNCICHH